MNLERLDAITASYSKLRMAVIGDYCLDRYLEIDPAKKETSIETGLPVHNVVNIRSQPGGAGTILNNLVALGLKEIYAVGFCGEDGEGWELRRALQAKRHVQLDHFVPTLQRRTFTYTKPLLMSSSKPPEELNRLDVKNWTPTPPSLVECLQQAAWYLAGRVDAFILLDQVDLADTGVVSAKVLEMIAKITRQYPGLLILADSRRGLRDFPKVTFKMNAVELARLTGSAPTSGLAVVQQRAAAVARDQGQRVFVTLAERGIVGADPSGETQHVPALPVRGEIDIVGAGDAVTANLTAALASGGTLGECLELAMLAASIVIHQLGTTGTAPVEQLRALLHQTQ
ncbi:MAG: carbohydrate kinase [Verrucomicrobia bacterium]|nr:carbohydrate kinase [Verrucomicrobiota bacterium]